MNLMYDDIGSNTTNKANQVRRGSSSFVVFALQARRLFECYMPMRYFLIALFALNTNAANSTEQFIGKTVEYVLLLNKLELVNGNSINEPPSVSRGLYFESENREIQIFIARGQLPLTHDSDYNLDLYKSLKVIGYRTKDINSVKCFGEVLWHFDCGT